MVFPGWRMSTGEADVDRQIAAKRKIPGQPAPKKQEQSKKQEQPSKPPGYLLLNKDAKDKADAKAVLKDGAKSTPTLAGAKYGRTELRPSSGEMAWISVGGEPGFMTGYNPATYQDPIADIIKMVNGPEKPKIGDIGYKGQKSRTVEGKEYDALTSDYKLSAQYNGLLDELTKLDTDLYHSFDVGKDGAPGDNRVTWAEVGDRSKQKGAKAAFKNVYGRDPNADDTYTPNIDAYLNQLGIKDLQLDKSREAQDIVNDLYLSTGDIDAVNSGKLVSLDDGSLDRADVAAQLMQGIRGLQDSFIKSKGVAVTQGSATEYSELDITKFSQDQRTNLAMIIGTGIMEENPNVLLGIESAVADKVASMGGLDVPGDIASWGTAPEQARLTAEGAGISPYAAPGMRGLDLTSLADPAVKERLSTYTKALDQLIADESGADGLGQEKVFKLLSGEDVEEVSSKDYLAAISEYLPSKGIKLSGQDLAAWVVRQNEADAAASAVDETGWEYRSTGGDQSLRDLLYGAEAAAEATAQAERAAATPEGKPPLDQRVTELRYKAKLTENELLVALVNEGYFSSVEAARQAMGG